MEGSLGEIRNLDCISQQWQEKETTAGNLLSILANTFGQQLCAALPSLSVHVLSEPIKETDKWRISFEGTTSQRMTYL